MIELFRSLFAPPRHLILLLIAAWVGLGLSQKRAPRHQVRSAALEDLVFYSLAALVIGGRLIYVLAHLEAFSKSPLSLFALNLDVFDLYGGLGIALITAFLYGQRQKLPLWATLDALTPFFATLAIGLSLSQLAAGTAFGKPTNLPWAIELWNAPRHPTQIYQTLASLLTLGLVWQRKADPRPGRLFLVFAAWTAGWQLFLGAFRGDSVLILGGLRLEQILAWVGLAISLWLYEKRSAKSGANSHPTPSPNGDGMG
ncbi:MAG: prolipoprotein diacylglyceryl transferase [Anaerolineae bacterium]